MKKSQRWMSLLVTSSLVLLSPNALGETDGDWEFWYSGSTAAITGYNGPLADISIPSTVSRTESYEEQDDDGEWHTHYRTYQYSVTSIGAAFYGCSSLTSVVIPDSVTNIGPCAFYDCSGLTHVTIPDSVTSIGSQVFRGCSSLTSVTIPDNVTSIEVDAFYDCRGLTSVTIPASVTRIEDCSFLNCFRLASIRFAGEPPAAGDEVFLWVSDSARGYYTEQYAEAWEAVIDQDGKWEGLIMEKELRVDSANPAAGSLTLAWEMLEAETEGVTYSVWRGAGGSGRTRSA